VDSLHGGFVSPLGPHSANVIPELPSSITPESPALGASEPRNYEVPELPSSNTPELPAAGLHKLSGQMSLSFELPSHRALSPTGTAVGEAAIRTAANRAFIAMFLASYLEHAANSLPIEDVD